MAYLHRIIEEKLLDLLGHFPIVAVLGARQVGKTTLVQHLDIPGLRTVIFDPVIDRFGAREDPDLFLQNQPRPLFLDEIQHAPEILAALKREVDSDQKPGRFVISGSQNLAVHRGVSESLAGRVAILDLYPMSRRELVGQAGQPGFLQRFLFEKEFDPLGYACDSSQAIYPVLWRGGMPGRIELPDRLLDDYFSSYLQTYLERDVRLAAEIGSLSSFGRFFGLLAALTASEINHSQLGRELAIDRKTAQNWCEIASATFQWIEIPAYSRNPVKRISGRSKGYFGDTGLACHLQRITSPDALAAHPLAGRLFETFVVHEVLRLSQGWPARPAVHHFRSHGGAEVDLVLEFDGILHPLEIKLTTNPTGRDQRGFNSLAATFPASRVGPGLLICSCDSVRQVTSNTIAVPWWEL